MISLTKPITIDYLRTKPISKSVDRYSSFNNKVNNNANNKNKPIIDYKIKIRNLENEIMLTNQKFNDVKKKNLESIDNLNELRKNVNIRKIKLENEVKELTNDENNFLSLKANIENTIKNKEEDNTFKMLYKDQKELFIKNDVMIQKIKEADKDTTQKLAAKKYLEHEKKKLQEQEKKCVNKWNKELKNFYEENNDLIKKIQSYDDSSKVLEILNLDKIKELEEMLQKIYIQTNLDDIDSLVKYFIDCSKEV